MAENLDVTVRYTADTSGLVAASQRAEEAVQSVGTAAQSSSAKATAAVVTLTDAEKRLAAQMIGAQAAIKAKAAATGLSVTQLKSMERQLGSASAAADMLEKSERRAAYGGKVFRAQLADIATTASMGISPLTILAQQGPDLVHAMEAGGGAAATFKAAFGGLTSVLMAAAPIVAAVTVAAAALGTAYVVLRNNTEDADSAQGLLAARMSGLQHVADSAKSAIADLAATTKRFYESVTETEYQAAEATGVLTAEEVAQAKAIQALRAQIEPQILAQNQLIAAKQAENRIIDEQLSSYRISQVERDKLNKTLRQNATEIDAATKAIEREDAALTTGIDNIAKTTGARMREREEMERAAAARKAEERARKASQQAMIEQRWAQEQLNAAFDAEIERLNVRAGFLPTLQSKVEGLSDAEIEYRKTIEEIDDAERMGALTSQEAYELREAASRDWVAANAESVQKVTEAEQRLVDKREKDHEQYLKQLDEQYDAQLAIASGIIGQVGSVLSATTAFSDMAMAKGEEAHARLSELQSELASEREQYAQEQREAAIELDMRRSELTAAELADLAQVNAEKEAMHNIEVARLEAQIAITRRNTKESRVAAAKAAKFAKAAAIADVTFKTAQAIMAAFAQFGPPPSPLGIASAGLAAAAGAIQIGAIAATELPTYHVGGVKPGETLSRHLPGEGVLNATATRQLGTDGVRDLNMGRMPMAPVLRIGRNEVREMERIRERGGLGVQVGRSTAATRGISGREVLA